MVQVGLVVVLQVHPGKIPTMIAPELKIFQIVAFKKPMAWSKQAYHLTIISKIP